MEKADRGPVEMAEARDANPTRVQPKKIRTRSLTSPKAPADVLAYWVTAITS